MPGTRRAGAQAAYHAGAIIRYSQRQNAGIILLALSLVAIAALTLVPLPSQTRQSAATPFLCLFCGGEGAADFILNIVLFVPVGIALRLVGFRFSAAATGTLLLTGAVEGLQYAVIAGRDAALGDLVANTLGGMLGHAVAGHWRALFLPAPRAAKRLAIGWAVVVAGTVAFLAWALQPSLPEGTWYGQWVVGDREEEWFDGRVVRATLGEQPLTHWRLEDSEARREALRDRPIRLWAEIVSGAPRAEPGRIVSVASDSARFVALTAVSRELRFGLRLRARQVRLRSPAFGLVEALPEGPGITMEVEGVFDRRNVTVGTRIAGVESRLAFRVHPLADGWMLLLPWTVRGDLRTALFRAAWLAGLFLPLGWWVARSRRRPVGG